LKVKSSHYGSKAPEAPAQLSTTTALLTEAGMAFGAGQIVLAAGADRITKRGGK